MTDTKRLRKTFLILTTLFYSAAVYYFVKLYQATAGGSGIEVLHPATYVVLAIYVPLLLVCTAFLKRSTLARDWRLAWFLGLLLMMLYLLPFFYFKHVKSEPQ